MARWDKRIDNEEEWREAGLIPAPELAVKMSITLKALESRVFKGLIKPRVKGKGGHYNWYKDRKYL